MLPEAFPPVPITPEMVRVVIALEESVLFDDPGDLRPYVRPDAISA
jgi:hypothetical protein